MKGPFLSERLTYLFSSPDEIFDFVGSPRYALTRVGCELRTYRFSLRRMISLSDPFFGLRVRRPSAGLPHGVLGLPPGPVLPSPPPCGWSAGFIVDPRTVGRLPSHRVRPALPPDSFSCSRLPTWPSVAVQRTWTRRSSPDGMRTTA